MRRLEDLPDASLRLFDRPAPPRPESVRSVFMIGICGKGMGALAELMVKAGYEVSGSDEAAYPPMSTRLAEIGVPICEGYSAENVAAASPDLVVVGNSAAPEHPEATYARDQEIPQISLPEALAYFFLMGRRPHVVAGTHGKTTTAGMLSHVLRHAGCDPGFFIGGVMANYGATCALGEGAPFVVEGDEYDSAYYDKRPKFMHYRPHTAIVTSMEFDHADIYADWSDYRRAFRAFAGLLPSNGLLILNGDDAEVRALANYAWARVRFVGFEGGDDDITASNVTSVDGGQTMEVWLRGERLGELFIPMSGWGNRFNALAVTAAALDERIPFETIADAFRTFRGMERRQQIIGEGDGVIVVDDFAHHPTAVRVTLEAVREQWSERRVVAVFEPRSNSSRRKVFERPYAEALTAADVAFLSAPAIRDMDREDDLMDVSTVAEIARDLGLPTAAHAGADSLLGPVLQELRSGDVVLVMSNGSFDNLPRKLLDALRQRTVAGASV